MVASAKTHRRRRNSETQDADSSGASDTAERRFAKRSKLSEPEKKPEAEAAPSPLPEQPAISDYEVSEESLLALKNKGIQHFFPIQAKCFGPIMDKKHVIGRARTGTGKTLAFALPVVEGLVKRGKTPKPGRAPRVLCLLPTRELATQVYEDFQSLQCNPQRFDTLCVYGGTPDYSQIEALRRGIDVLVGTPGRTLDLLNREILVLKKVKVVILDEADQMLQMGFREDVEAILDATGSQSSEAKARFQLLLFTATLPSWVSTLAQKYTDASDKRVVVDVVTEGDLQTAEGVQHLAIQCHYNQRANVLANVINLYAGVSGKCIIFTETKVQANEIGLNSKISHICQVLHGDIQQTQRQATMNAFKEGRFRCLVATDVAARGLHIDDIALVVQLLPPRDIDTFVHRSGRTGRAGRSGTNLIFYSPKDYPFLQGIEQKTGMKFRRVAVPQPFELAHATAMSLARTLGDGIDGTGSNGLLEPLKEAAETLILRHGAREAVALCLLEMSGLGRQSSACACSALTGREGFKTFRLVFRNSIFRTNGYVWTALKRQFVGLEDVVDQLTSMVPLQDHSGVVFDVPDAVVTKFEEGLKRIEMDEQRTFDISVVNELPQLDESRLASQAAPSTSNVNHVSFRGRQGDNRWNSRGGRRY